MEAHSINAVAPAVAFGVIFLVGFLCLISTIVSVIIFCKIFSKAGYNWALGLLILVPFANMIIPFYLAFAEWPVQREIRSLRQDPS